LTGVSEEKVDGRWFDGQSSRARDVRLSSIAPALLRIEGSDGDLFDWPVAEVVISPRLGTTPRVLRRRGHGQIECPDSPLWDRWLPRHSSRIEVMADWLERRRLAIATAALATLVGTLAFVRFGVPWVATEVAERMPVSVEHHVSDQIVTLLRSMHADPSRLAQSRQQSLKRAFAGLVAREPRAEQMRLMFVQAKGLGPNAFALPDGRIFLTDALVELAGSDDEVLAVLAHEAGHHVHRHGMRQAIESSSVFLLAGVLFGDASGSSLAVSLPAVLLTNGYSRGHEREADAYAFDLLKRHGRSPEAFATMLARLSKAHESELGGGAVGYLSTHPPSPERIAEARRAAAR